MEESLKVKFPSSYKWFLKNYGFGGMFGVEILGCGKAELPSVIRETERYRKLGLDNRYIVIQNCDEWVHCLDLETVENDDCEVISWDRINGLRHKVSGSFYEFLITSFEDGKKSWEEELKRINRVKTKGYLLMNILLFFQIHMVAELIFIIIIIHSRIILCIIISRVHIRFIKSLFSFSSNKT
ncbi:MAG: SMI1/KNR4 family protein [Clostridiaceae bacterium]